MKRPSIIGALMLLFIAMSLLTACNNAGDPIEDLLPTYQPIPNPPDSISSDINTPSTPSQHSCDHIPSLENAEPAYFPHGAIMSWADARHIANINQDFAYLVNTFIAENSQFFPNDDPWNLDHPSILGAMYYEGVLMGRNYVGMARGTIDDLAAILGSADNLHSLAAQYFDQRFPAQIRDASNFLGTPFDGHRILVLSALITPGWVVYTITDSGSVEKIDDLRCPVLLFGPSYTWTARTEAGSQAITLTISVDGRHLAAQIVNHQ